MPTVRCTHAICCTARNGYWGTSSKIPRRYIRQREDARACGNRRQRHRDCVACDQRYLCGGGCRARSLFRYGDLTHRDAYCTMTKTYYDKLGASLAAQG